MIAFAFGDVVACWWPLEEGSDERRGGEGGNGLGIVVP